MAISLLVYAFARYESALLCLAGLLRRFGLELKELLKNPSPDRVCMV